MKKWMLGVANALLNGMASAVVLVIADPINFNLDAGLPLLLKTSALMGLIGVANYVKSSPFDVGKY